MSILKQNNPQNGLFFSQTAPFALSLSVLPSSSKAEYEKCNSNTVIN